MMGQSDPTRWGPTHLVEVACSCNDIEHCLTEKYIADIRILLAELETQHGRHSAGGTREDSGNRTGHS
jgi:hypothetical protein